MVNNSEKIPFTAEEQFIRNFKVKKVVCLLDSKLLFGNGHTSLMFVDHLGRGIYYGTSRIEQGYEAVKGKYVDVQMNRIVLNKKQVDEVFIKGKLPEAKVQKDINETIVSFIDGMFRFDKYISFPVIFNKDGRKILNKAEELYKDPGQYNLFERNCNHMVQEILFSVGLNFSSQKGEDAQVFMKQIKDAVRSLLTLDPQGAKRIFETGYKKCYEMGITPVGAFDKGIYIANKKGFKYGDINLPNKQYEQMYDLVVKGDEGFIGKERFLEFRKFYKENKKQMNQFQRQACERFISKQREMYRSLKEGKSSIDGDINLKNSIGYDGLISLGNKIRETSLEI